MMRKTQREKEVSATEWSYIGEGDGFKLEESRKIIDDFFEDENIYLVEGRHNSEEIRKEEAAQILKDKLHDVDLTLCNTEFKKFIVFSKIGVLKKGEYRS